MTVLATTFLNARSTNEASGLSFETENDALNYARQLADRGRELFSAKTLGVFERYKRGHCCLEVCGRVFVGPQDFALRLRLVPNQPDSTEGTYKHAATTGIQAYAAEMNLYGQNALVFYWVGEPAEGAQQVVAAPIGLESREKRMQADGDSFPRAVAGFQLTQEVSVAVPEWEVSVGQTGRPYHRGSRMNGLVERVTQIVNKTHRVAFDLVWNIGEQPNLVDDLIGLTLIVSDLFVLGLVSEGLAATTEIVSVRSRETSD